MALTGAGWELRVERLGLQRSGDRARTYGRYRLYVDGLATGIDGHVCEAIGPGDNSKAENGRRIEADTYSLSTQFSTYVSIGYSKDTQNAGAAKMPGILLLGTSKRTGILIHPAHPPKSKLYLSSIGCLNPTDPLGAADVMDYWDSRARVIQLIDSLREFLPASFAQKRRTAIPGATVVIEGEPDDPWPDGTPG
ncbi:hypothetical protein [Sphingomonas aerolata]|uniref:hypothetical protein n=1 Tax=Sphingomonas aerolata TaxID=185951 RepID=UPI002FE02F9C